MTSLYHGTAFSNRVFFAGKIIPWVTLGIVLWNECMYYQIFIATAYDLPIFNNKWNKKVNSHLTYWPSPPRVCLHMLNGTPWQVKLIFYSTPTAYKLTVSQACYSTSKQKQNCCHSNNGIATTDPLGLHQRHRTKFYFIFKKVFRTS